LVVEKLGKDAGRELFAYIMGTMKCAMIEKEVGRDVLKMGVSLLSL
jgi:hypothetical protein